MAQVTAGNVSKSYGDFHALSDIDVDIANGEILTLLGPAGSGKTTFLIIGTTVAIILKFLIERQEADEQRAA